LTVIGTGDFTHPAWRAKLAASLEEAESGLYRLNARALAAAGSLDGAEGFDPSSVRFVYGAEISGIYKQGGRTRKVHSVVLTKSSADAEKFSASLAKIGNVESDGRPILGLSARDALDMALNVSEDVLFIPAHIWTPWFSVLGSMSGFDSIEECFGDLTDWVYALETGLSSDPEMNYAVSALDKFLLVSNSDAHSAENLGRECNEFSCGLSYEEMYSAIKTRNGFEGTIEFFPEEGKYHFDGHRACGARLSPDETERNGGKCPVCGGPVTVGVMSRVAKLADRPFGFVPQGAKPYKKIIPLAELIAAAEGKGAKTISAKKIYDRILKEFGSELNALLFADAPSVESAAGGRLASLLIKARAGEIIMQPGYDGEYGRLVI